MRNDDFSLKLVVESGEISAKDTAFMTKAVHMGENEPSLSARMEPTLPTGIDQKDNSCNHQMLDFQNVTDSDQMEIRCNHQILGSQNDKVIEQMEKGCNLQSLGLQNVNDIEQKERSFNHQSIDFIQNDKEVEQRETSLSLQMLGIQKDDVASGCDGTLKLANGPNQIQILTTHSEIAPEDELAERGKIHNVYVTSKPSIPNPQPVSSYDSIASHSYSSTAKSKSKKEAQPSQFRGHSDKFGKSSSPLYARKVRSQLDSIEVSDSYFLPL